MCYVWIWHEAGSDWIAILEPAIIKAGMTVTEAQQHLEYDVGLCTVISRNKPTN